MKTLFKGYYRPTEEEFQKTWQEGVFSFDANVLRHLYRYTPSARADLLRVFSALREKVWLTHQAAKEYHQGRASEIATQIKLHDDITAILQKAIKEIEASGRSSPAYYSHALSTPIRDRLDSIINEVGAIRQQYPDYTHSDPSRDALTDLFDGKVGQPYNDADHDKLTKEAKRRYDMEIPPGYKDKKPGDAIIWFQLLDHAKATKRAVVFVTDDSKEDWWFKQSGKTIGPRPELVMEMEKEAGVFFYMYSVEQFLQYGNSDPCRRYRAIPSSARYRLLILDANGSPPRSR